MRIGTFSVAAAATLEELTAEVQAAAAAGLDSAFFGQTTAWDAITVAAIAGRAAPGIETGTAITTTYPRHPIALASQAVTAQALTGGRFTLGIGPSHRSIVQDAFGYSYDRPARHTEEYLTALRPLLRGEEVDFHGETLTAVGQVDAPGATPPSVLISALGPVMLRIAGELADGTVTTWVTAQGVAEHIVPGLTKAAEAAGRPAPRVAVGTVMALTGDPDGARERLAEQLGFAGEFPGYRAMLDRQGLSGVHETIIAGDEAEIERAVRRFAAAGATDLLVSALGDDAERARTIELLGALRG